MASISHPPSKRMRAADAQRPRDPNEELSQVAGLVERRRMQNRISQRNYRNKIRDRLEALEALVDKTAKDKPSPAIRRRDGTATPRSMHSTDSIEYPTRPVRTQSPEIPSEPTYSWDDMNDYLNPSPTEFDTLADFTETHNNQEPGGQYNHALPFTTARPNVALPSPAMTTPQSNPFDKQTETAKPEELTLSPSLCHSTSNLNPMVSSTTPDLPIPPTNSPVQPPSHGCQTPYGYPVTFGAPYLPLSPASLSQNNIQAPPGRPLQVPPQDTIDQSLQHPISTSYFPTQQYVWVPVPVMALPMQRQPVPMPPPKAEEAKMQ